MMTSVGHGISIELSAHPSPAQRGQGGSYEVKIKNATTVDWDVLHENHIAGPALRSTDVPQ